MESFLNEIQVSEKIQVSLACLRRWRLRGEGPQYVKVGPLARYRPEAIEQWVDALPTGGNGRKPRLVRARAIDLPQRLSRWFWKWRNAAISSGITPPSENTQ
jgi:predicted DNA-binding transcriptional regulator AlpA